ncbi:MAG: carboxypeptidase-like regulatory domain-containing protein, partial [Planctomycetota bacterium]
PAPAPDPDPAVADPPGPLADEEPEEAIEHTVLVLDQGGDPATDVEVEIEGRARARTDAAGLARFRLPAGAHRAVAHPAFELMPHGANPWDRPVPRIFGPDPRMPGVYERRFVLAAGEGPSTTELRVNGAVTVRGRMVDAADRPIASARLEIRLADGPNRPEDHHAALTDREGGFTIRGLPPRSLEIGWDLDRKGGSDLCPPPARRFEPGRRRDVDLGVFRALPPESLVAAKGRIVDQFGAPRRGIDIVAFRAGAAEMRPLPLRSVRSGDDGRFRLSGLPPSAELEVRVAALAYRGEGEWPIYGVAAPPPRVSFASPASGASVHDLGDLVVVAPALFRARFELAPGETLPAGATLSGRWRPIGETEWREGPGFGDNPRATWHCQTPHDPVEIEIRYAPLHREARPILRAEFHPRAPAKETRLLTLEQE